MSILARLDKLELSFLLQSFREGKRYCILVKLSMLEENKWREAIGNPDFTEFGFIVTSIASPDSMFNHKPVEALLALPSSSIRNSVVTVMGDDIIDPDPTPTTRASLEALLELYKRLEVTEKALVDVQVALYSPETAEFDSAIVHESGHQEVRWGSGHDSSKAPFDWFWLLGYLSGKAAKALDDGDVSKGLHHIVSSGAVLRRWFAHTKTKCVNHDNTKQV